MEMSPMNWVLTLLWRLMLLLITVGGVARPAEVGVLGDVGLSNDVYHCEVSCGTESRLNSALAGEGKEVDVGESRVPTNSAGEYSRISSTAKEGTCSNVSSDDGCASEDFEYSV
jgi:hypothetical protein